ncbi:SDR family NAD(P)-dependent oxidoreductase [Rhodococcus sp. NPDC057529]|uniref:SDR family NAD(P)-dependent oxidoreductase n=1 Tax=Rhodococcus sp. NPDC057529 TaxID=3346158 RepID=UPI003670252E
MSGRPLDHRVAIITGAASGLGREYAHHFARSGARLVLTDVASAGSSQGAQSALDTLRTHLAGLGTEVVIHYGDIGDESTSDELVNLAVDTFGDVDVLINNAGNWYENDIVDTDTSAWDAVVRTHLRGSFLTTRAVGRYWRSVHQSGRPVAAAIVNTTSRSTLNAIPTHGVYAAAKAGVMSLTAVTAKELEPYGVRVNCVAPVARTPMAAQVTAMKSQIEAIAPDVIFDELAPANVAPLVAYLSTQACSMSGQVFFCRGGVVEVYESWKSHGFITKGGQWTVSELAVMLPACVGEGEVD